MPKMQLMRRQNRLIIQYEFKVFCLIGAGRYFMDCSNNPRNAFVFSKRNDHALSHGNNIIKLEWYPIGEEIPNGDG
jgi:hypothetical protein